MGTAFKTSTLLKLGVPYLVFFFAPIGWSIIAIGVFVDV